MIAIQEKTFAPYALHKESSNYNILLSSLSILVNLGIGLWGLLLFNRSPHIASLLLLIVLGGMVYDNGVILAGNWIDPGLWLKRLNYMRHIIHNLCVPLLVLVGMAFLDRAGNVWVHGSIANFCSLGLILSLIALGLSSCVGLELTPKRVGNSLQYKPENPGLPLATILTSLIMTGIGASLWMQVQWPWLLVGTIVMIAGNGLPSSQVRCHICTGVEIVFMLTLFATVSQIL